MRFDEELARGRLVAGVCDSCMPGRGAGPSGAGWRAWPPTGTCRQCLRPVRWVRVPPCGTLVEFSRTADGRPFCLAEFSYGIRLAGMLLAPRGGGGGCGGADGRGAAPGRAAEFAPAISQRVMLESCSLAGDRPAYTMRAACDGEWPPHPPQPHSHPPAAQPTRP